VKARLDLSYLALTVVILGLAVAYLTWGRAGEPRSQALLAAPAALLLLSHVRYTWKVEGRPLLRILPYSAAVWGFTWFLELTGVWGGFYSYQSAALGTALLAGVPVLIPTVWMIFCWLAESITEFLFAPGRGRTGTWIVRPLASGWILLAIAFALEWQFSKAIGVWRWIEAGGGLRIDGVPAVNFAIWFIVGLSAPPIARLARAPFIAYRTENRLLRALPLVGFGFLLSISTGLNFGRGFPAAGIFGLASLAVIAASLVLLPRRTDPPARS
jgi:hypothetical protein